MHANFNAIGCSRENVLVPMAHMNSGDSNTLHSHCLIDSGLSHRLSPSTPKGCDYLSMAELAILYALTYDYT